MSAHDSSAPAIAVVGMAGRFPGAESVDALWRNLVSGVRSIRDLSEQELLAAGLPRTALTQPALVRAGAMLADIESFDSAFFGYTPHEAELTDPQHRLLLECAWEALENAGYAPDEIPALVGVFAGSAFSTYMLNNLYSHPELMEQVGLLRISVGNDKDAVASTLSYKLNLKGPSVSVQTFCSTSLVAVHLACQSLLTYECDLALAGGVAVAVPQGQGYLHEEGGILSPEDRKSVV